MRVIRRTEGELNAADKGDRGWEPDLAEVLPQGYAGLPNNMLQELLRLLVPLNLGVPRSPGTPNWFGLIPPNVCALRASPRATERPSWLRCSNA
jgi:hypothetical protein